MAEFGNVSDRGENTCETKSNAQVPDIPQNENNLLLNENRNSGNTDESAGEKIAKLLEEKLHLDERGREIQDITTGLMQEYRRLTFERQSQARSFIASNKNAESIARQIRDRLLVVYSSCKAYEPVFEKFLDISKKKLQNTYMLGIDNKVALERKVTLLETNFSLFQQQLTRLETLMKPDYDILCQENSSCFTVVMEECNNIDDNAYTITSIILEE